jgi:NAD(P)-dependent dehydrogenase (short-subunit alcohol dehydrogenase family)
MNRPFSLSGKNILITGASSGIGRQCAIRCSESGANVVLIARNTERLENTLRQLSNGQHSVFSIDITDYSGLEAVISEAVKKTGKIDGFIHAAGIETTLPLKNNTIDTYTKIFATNVFAGFEIAKIISLKKYLSEKGGSFVFISSVMGVTGESGKVAYSSSKGALIAGVKSMALELSPKKIRVNAISPAMVETEMAQALFSSIPEESKNEILKLHPLGMGTPDDVAWASIYLLSDAAQWVTGSNLIVDGGYTAR